MTVDGVHLGEIHMSHRLAIFLSALLFGALALMAPAAAQMVPAPTDISGKLDRLELNPGEVSPCGPYFLPTDPGYVTFKLENRPNGDRMLALVFIMQVRNVRLVIDNTKDVPFFSARMNAARLELVQIRLSQAAHDRALSCFSEKS